MQLYQALITLDGWTFLAQICNLMIQLVIFKKLLLNPVKKVIAERKAKADSQIADAEKLRTEAEAMKAEYEQNLQNARTEANQIVASAQKTAAARSEDSSRAAAVSRTPQLPSMMTPAGAAGSASARTSEEAAGSAVTSDEAAALEAVVSDEAERSRLRTTVYQVWVAQSSTWGAATQAAASTATTSTAMPMPFFSRISRV